MSHYPSGADRLAGLDCYGVTKSVNCISLNALNLMVKVNQTFIDLP